MIRGLLRTVMVLLVGCTYGPALAQTTIELRSAAKVEPGRVLRLEHLADVSGDDAAALGGAVIRESYDGKPTDIDVQEVRAALDRSKLVRWGRTTLRGSTCTLVPAGPAPEKVEAKKAEPASQRPASVKLDGPETVRTRIVHALAQLYKVPPEDLRFLFEDRDREILDTATAGRRVDVQPTNAASSAKVGMRVYIFHADKLATQKTVSVDVLVRRTVATAVAPMSRGQAITPTDYSVAEQWLAPSAAVACSPDQLSGAVIKTRVAAGEVLTGANTEAPIIVKKGDVVEVHCLSGNIHLKASRARALESGRDGEIIAFQLEGSKQSFKARMSGRGTAVLVLNDPTGVADAAKQEVER